MADIEKKDDAVHIPIDGSLDLHMFAPQDAINVVEEYLNACIEKGIHEVRIIHGKGKGVIRRQVHAFLEKHPMVEEFRLDSGPSGWGASIARLKNTSVLPEGQK
jgi:DNA-nicking Smr family endonuclease